MPVSILPISRLIKVSVSLSGLAAQGQNLNNMMIVGNSAVIDTAQRYRSYASIAGVGADFGPGTPEYLAAVLWFEQSPSPNSLLIGRWASAVTAASLVGAPLSTAQQNIANFTVIGANGGFSISVGGVLSHPTGINLTGVTNLNGVASAINAVLTGATCTWNAAYNQFVITSTATGATATISFVSAATVGTDISTLLGMRAADNGAYVAAGQAAESALAAVTALDQAAGQQFLGLTVVGTPMLAADHQAISGYVEAGANYHYYGVSTQDAGAVTPGVTTDIGYVLSQALYNRTMVQYSSNNPYSVTSALARILTTDYTANNSVIDLMYKQEPGIMPENLSVSQITAAEAKNVNVFVAYNNNTAIIDQGNSCSGLPAALIIGSMAFAVALQTGLFNALYGSATKIPQTDAGMHILATAIENVATQFVNDGFLGPGTWTTGGFGTLNLGDFIAKGYYLYVPPLATQSAALRAAGSSVPFQLAAKFSGAVRNVNLAVVINQ